MANYFGDIDNVTLEDYNENYSLLFETEKQLLLKLLGDCVIAVEHIGSTAIPGIKGKAVIDIAITTNSFPIGDNQIKSPENHSYVYWQHNPDKHHQFFFKGLPHTHIVHIYPQGLSEIKGPGGF